MNQQSYFHVNLPALIAALLALFLYGNIALTTSLFTPEVNRRLCRDPSPRVYSCRASVTTCFKIQYENP